MSTLFAILSLLIRVYTISHSQQSDEGMHCLHSQPSDQGLHYLPFSAVWSGSTLFAILSLIRVYTFCNSRSYQGLHCLPFSVCSGSTQFAILSSLIMVYTISCTLSMIKVKVYTVIFRSSLIRVYILPFSAVWSGSTLFAILSILIRFYTICHS